jgi:hypothetical protein
MWPAQESVKNLTKKHITSNRDREGMNEKKRREEQYVRRREEHRSRGLKTQVQEGFQGQVKER